MAKKIILNILACFLCSILGIALLAVLALRQSNLTDTGAVFVKTYAYFFPMFYVILFIAANVLIRANSYSRLKTLMGNNAVLFIGFGLFILLLAMPFSGIVSDSILLDAMIATCYILSLNIYLKLLAFPALALPALALPTPAKKA
jgi:hypothetical protein